MKRIVSFLLAVLMIAAASSFSFLQVNAEESVTLLSYDGVKKAFERSKKSVTAVYKSSEGTNLPYRLFVPYDYDPNKSYPLVLFFHGAGEAGSDNTHIFRGGSILQRLLITEEYKKNPCFILAPQCADVGKKWVSTPWEPGTYDHTKIQKSPYMTAAEELLDQVVDQYSIDQSSLYVSGMSMGGFGTWDLISRNPDKFAAAIPVCGGTDESYLEGLRGMPIRTFHAQGDPIVNCAGSRKANEILSGHGDFLYTEFSDNAHNVWDRAYATAGLTDWLFAQKTAITPTVTADENVTVTFDQAAQTAPKALEVQYTVKEGFKVASVQYKGKDVAFADGKFTVANYMGGEIKVTSAPATADTVIVNGYKGYVDEKDVDLYFVFDDASVGKEVEVTVSGKTEKKSVTADGVSVTVATTALEEKIIVKFNGEVVAEYTLKQYLEAVSGMESASTAQKAVASAILNGKGYSEHLTSVK